MGIYSEYELDALLKLLFCQLHANKPVIRYVTDLKWDIMLRLDGTYFDDHLINARPLFIFPRNTYRVS
jgi:hypothetical protein